MEIRVQSIKFNADVKLLDFVEKMPESTVHEHVGEWLPPVKKW